MRDIEDFEDVEDYEDYDDIDEIDDVDWYGEFADLAEVLREGLEDDYGDATSEEMQDALHNVFDSLTLAESFNLGKALKQMEQGASQALRDPTLGQIARTAIPVASGAFGTVVGGPVGTAVGSSIGQAAVKALPPTGKAKPAVRAVGTVAPAAVANGSAAALRGLVLTQKPEALKSLLAVALGQHGRTHVDGVPVGAVLGLLSSVFGQAAADADELLYRREGDWVESTDEATDVDEDWEPPADRAVALYADLVDTESEELAEAVGW